MNLQGRNLSANISGADVALLQTELGQLGYTIATVDVARKSYGPTTGQSVRDFQRKHGLPVTGVVDPPTAKAINAAVDTIVPARFSVTGVVRHQDGTVLAGLTVRAADVDFRNRIEWLADPVVTNAAGQYQIIYTSDQFRDGERRTADVSVHVSNAEGLELAVSPISFNAPAGLDSMTSATTRG
jgi:peptidoglycan hydrolase-like protein with peptidoglycan-binding domain